MDTSTDDSPDTIATPRSPAGALPAGLVIALIVAASLLLLSVFLPWSNWNNYYSRPKSPKHVEYGTETSIGDIVVLAGMAALALAFMVRTVSHRFAAYAAVPSGFALIAMIEYGRTFARGNAVLAPSVAWGYWVAMAMAVAVVALSLVAMRRRPAGRDQS